MMFICFSALFSRHSGKSRNLASRVCATRDFDSKREEKVSIWTPAFAGVTALFLFSACTQQAVIDSTSAAMKNTCQNMRNCTVNDDNAAAR
jgi:hypothetical protein